jgi:WhiB family redox-sensing transcriptional regulator
VISAGTRELQILTEVREMSWADQALCAETWPDAFFPEKGDSTREAKAVCCRCDVRTQCLAYALEHSAPEDVGWWGVWGGLSAQERRALLLKRGQPVPQPKPAARCRKGLHFRTRFNTRIDGGATRCKDCEREQGFRSKESAA